MLDENLPTFFYKTSPNGLKHHTGIFLSQYGSEPEPVYSLRHADPAAPTSRNCYATALFDSYNPDVLYGETLVRPGWTQPSLSQEEIRRHGGVPPPPEPVLPTEFTIQLYNPDQQVTVVQKPGSWGGSSSYEFSMPQTTFRTPSASTLDRTQHDPAASANTIKLNFTWRRESKLSKDLTCFMVGKSTDSIIKKKHRDPDITVSLFRSLRELTIYEPNLYRVEMEDPKGLEVVLLIAAATIKDLYLSNTSMKETFNVSDASRVTTPLQPALTSAGGAAPPGAIPSTTQATKRKSLPRLQTTPPNHQSPSRIPPAADPRTQWELDAETAQLRAQTAAEEREQRRLEAAQRREREQAAEAETQRLRKWVEQEEREARRRQEAVDRETERLRREYGHQGMVHPPMSPQQPLPHQQPHQQLQYLQQHPPRRPASGPLTGSATRPSGSRVGSAQPGAGAGPPRMQSNGLYQLPQGGPAYASSSSSSGALMSGANPAAVSQQHAGAGMKPKKSFFGLRSVSDEGQQRLNKNSSVMR